MIGKGLKSTFQCRQNHSVLDFCIKFAIKTSHIYIYIFIFRAYSNGFVYNSELASYGIGMSLSEFFS